jgi:hypothetical protein
MADYFFSLVTLLRDSPVAIPLPGMRALIDALETENNQ